MISAGEILKTLPMYYGTEQYHRIGFPFPKNYVLTDGAKYLADSADCYWLMNKIAAHNTKDFRTRNPFQVWELFVSGNSGVVRCSDGNNNDLITEDVEYTDFPISEIKLYAIDDGTWFVILLPGEY